MVPRAFRFCRRPFSLVLAQDTAESHADSVADFGFAFGADARCLLPEHRAAAGAFSRVVPAVLEGLAEFRAEPRSPRAIRTLQGQRIVSLLHAHRFPPHVDYAT